MTTYKERVTKIGNSLYIIIPSKIKKEKEIINGDYLSIDIEKLNDEKVKTYFCKSCVTYFSSDDDIVYCPICGQEDTIEPANEEEFIENEERP